VRLAWSVALLVLVGAMIASVGLGRRASRERELAAALNAARHDVHALVLGSVAVAPGTDPDMLIRSELNRLARTRTVFDDDAGSAARLLASVLGAWPEGAPTQTSSISVTPDLVTVTALVADPDVAQRLTDALGSLDGWRAENPSVNPERDAIRTTVRIRREEGG
jgi:hypothetical protein